MDAKNSKENDKKGNNSIVEPFPEVSGTVNDASVMPRSMSEPTEEIPAAQPVWTRETVSELHQRLCLLKAAQPEDKEYGAVLLRAWQLGMRAPICEAEWLDPVEIHNRAFPGKPANKVEEVKRSFRPKKVCGLLNSAQTKLCSLGGYAVPEGKFDVVKDPPNSKGGRGIKTLYRLTFIPAESAANPRAVGPLSGLGHHGCDAESTQEVADSLVVVEKGRLARTDEPSPGLSVFARLLLIFAKREDGCYVGLGVWFAIAMMAIMGLLPTMASLAMIEAGMGGWHLLSGMFLLQCLMFRCLSTLWRLDKDGATVRVGSVMFTGDAAIWTMQLIRGKNAWTTRLRIASLSAT